MKITADDVSALIALYKATTARPGLTWTLHGPVVDTFAATLIDTTARRTTEGQGDTLGDAIRVALKAMEVTP